MGNFCLGMLPIIPVEGILYRSRKPAVASYLCFTAMLFFSFSKRAETDASGSDYCGEAIQFYEKSKQTVQRRQQLLKRGLLLLYREK